jgi:hypothetical protein
LRGKISSNIINNITNTRRITPVIPIDTEDGPLSVALVLVRKNDDVFR